LPVAPIYLLAIAVVLGFNLLRFRASQPAVVATEQVPAVFTGRPFFSLSTNRTFGPDERARVWASYQSVDHLDFRVYRVKDPVKFFKQLDDPHQMGNDDKNEVSGSYSHTPSMLERTRLLKDLVVSTVKNYVRSQIKREYRAAFNHAFRPQHEPGRTPLNMADYARVPLLNPDQMVSSWREPLAPLAQYDRRMISLGRREPGVYLVEAVNGTLRAYSIAVVTELAMVEKTSRDGEILIYVVNRKTGAPQPQARIDFVSGNKTLDGGVTDANGVLKKTLRPAKSPTATPAEDVDPEAETPNYLIMARAGQNFAISDLDSFYFSNVSDEDSEYDSSITGYLYTDRPVYRPAQHVYFKGILRRWTKSGYQMLEQKSVNVTVEDPNNGKIFEKELPMSARGSFNGELDLPEWSPLGSYQVRAVAGKVKTSDYFQVEEYKKPEFKVKVTGPQQFAAVGEKVKFTVDARYFFGAPVTKADVHYYITRSRYYHWWWGESDGDDAGDETESGDDEDDYEGSYYSGGDVVTEGDGVLDAAGRMTVEFEVPKPDDKDQWDHSYRLSAEVTDSSRREMQGSAGFVGTRGKTIADARPESYLYYQGDTAKIRVRTADYAGHPVSEPVTLKFTEQKWERVEKEEEYNGYKYKTYDYVSHQRELATTSVNTNAQGEAVYDYLVPSPGYIFVTAIVHENGREIVNHGGSFWAPERTGAWSDFSFRYEDENGIKLIPDKKSYQPGDTAHVLAILPKDQTHLLVTTELVNVMTARQIDAPGRSIVIDVPITSNCEPNVYLGVAFVQNNDMYNESKLISVPARDRMLKLDIIADKPEYKPRETASYTIVARNADGSPAPGAEVSLGVVDEAIYSVQPESAGNIKSEFYGRRYNQVETTLAIRFSFTGYSGDQPMQLAQNKPAYQLADFKNDSPLAEPTIRREFKDTAFWRPEVVTGNDGKANIKVKLPDNLTTWRATARAITSDTHVGSAVQKVISRKDVIMRLEMPRFLTQGDNVTISGVVHNFLKTEKATRISLELNGAELLSPATETVTIAPNGEHRVDWRVSAKQVGQLRLLAKALTDTESDAVELTMEIVPHGLKQNAGTVATMTQNDGEQTLSLDLPANPDAHARALRIEASPSIAGTLFGALDYLTSFPYGCTEQTMSSFLPNVIVSQALKDVPTAKIRATNDLPKKVQRGLDRLYSYQHEDGGWGWWKDDKTDPFMTAYVVDGLTLARHAGFPVEEWRLTRGRTKLVAIIEANKGDDGNPIDPETRAYMIYAVLVSGSSDAKYLEQLYANHEKLQPYGRALLALALKQRGDVRAGQIAAEIESSARVNEYDAHWETHRLNHYGRPMVLDTETTALSLKALSRITPKSPLLPQAARWLVNNRRNGYYWISTKETAFALFGLSDYLKVSQELAPDYTFEVYLNGEQLMVQHVGPSDAAGAKSFVIKRKALEVADRNSIRIVKHGRGVLYLAAGLEYFTADEEIQAAGSATLKLTREYFRLKVSEDDKGKKRWAIEPLSGELRSGDLIVSRLHIEGGRAQYLMIEDPIPAGCEQVSRLDGLGLNYEDHDWTDWYSAREFRDNRTVYFLNYFDGSATFKYAMRVEVPGEFRVAPARVELMYEPTVQANTANGRVTILDKK
jgi:uncharacterized protein YfaS (alpha-2-macroglobulin family)